MYIDDFQYDGRYLSDYNCIVCDLNENTKGIKNVSAGSNITFNKNSRNRGKQNSLISSQYNACIQAVFCIAKNPRIYDGTVQAFTTDEIRDLMKWLNRENFHKFKPITYRSGNHSIYYNASFNIEKVIDGNNGNVYMLRLTMETDSPHAYESDDKHSYLITNANLANEHRLAVFSDEIGDVLPSIKITCHSAGDFSITNITNGCTMLIKDCIENEVITVDAEKMTLVSSTGRNLYKSFNYEFLRLKNTLDETVNKITFSLPSKVEITYKPIVKYGA